MKQKRSLKPREHTEIALERIRTLFKEADLAFSPEPALSDRYAQLALSISKKYRVRMPPELKRKICKGCHSFLKPPYNSTVRLSKGNKVYRCLKCGAMRRQPYKKRAQNTNK